MLLSTLIRSPLRADPCYGTLAPGLAERNAPRHIPSRDGARATAAAAAAPISALGAAPAESDPCTATIAAPVADTTIAAQMTTRTTSRTIELPRTSHGSVTAAAAHTSAGTRTPAEMSGRSR